MSTKKYPFLFIPGPTTVRDDVMEAQTEAMMGHRTADFESLFAEVEEKLKKLYFTDQRVYIFAATGSAMQEAAIRNGVQQRVINFAAGGFGHRWHEVSVGCGKEATEIELEWGTAITPEIVDETLQKYEGVEAITVVHNETSTGVTSPVGEIAALLREKYPDTMLFVDAVSSFSGTKLPFDAWGVDLILTSSQKALSIPPGLALVAVSDRLLERAASVTGRGWYFDFLRMEKYLQRSTTPATPAISLIRALNVELNHIFEEGLEARFARHHALAERTQQWAVARGFELFAPEGYRSPTVTNVTNTRKVDIGNLNSFLRERGMIISNGYGKLKGQAFRIGHMGHVTMEQLETLLTNIDEYLEKHHS